MTLHNKTWGDYHISLQTKQNNISHYSAALTTVCCREHPANVNCFSQSRHQTTFSLHIVNPHIQRFLEIRSLTVIFHNDSSNHYQPPLSFSCRFCPDIPSIINCHCYEVSAEENSLFLSRSSIDITEFSSAAQTAQMTCCVVCGPCGDSMLLFDYRNCVLFIMVMYAFQKQHLVTFALQVNYVILRCCFNGTADCIINCRLTFKT